MAEFSSFVQWAWDNHPILTVLGGVALVDVVMIAFLWIGRKSNAEYQRELMIDLASLEQQNQR